MNFLHTRQMCVNLARILFQVLPSRCMHLGTYIKKHIAQKHSRDMVCVRFIQKCRQGYVDCANYMAQKLPLTNVVLRACSCIAPDAKGTMITAKMLKKLPVLLKSDMTDQDRSEYDTVTVYNEIMNRTY